MTQAIILGYSVEDGDYCVGCAPKVLKEQDMNLENVITDEGLEDLKESSQHTIFCDECKEAIG